jgi:glycosyltransferase involved in cell wall biosynthesis
VEEKETPQEPQKQQIAGYKRYYNRRKRYHHRPNESPQHERVKSAFKKISIVIPLFNEEESIIPLSHELRKALSRLNTNYEVILIDDGSTDLSLEKLKEVTKTDNRFRYLSFRKNYGKSAALHVGFKSATGDAVVTMDADLQDDPGEIHTLLKKLEDGYDLCSGWKKKRQDPFIKKISSKFFNFVTRIISGIKIHDFNCGLKAYKKEVVENVNVYGELHRYIPVLAKWQGYTITEVPVMHHPRRYGKTKFGITRFFKGFIDLVTVIFVTRYIKRPMHFFGFLGAISFLAGFLVLGYLTVLWIQGISLSNRPMIFLGMLLIIVGVQLFAVGLLGEVIAHNTKDDREYVIKEKS